METVREYVTQFDGVKREWIEEYTAYMEEKHSELEETIWFRMPTYKIGCSYVAFSVSRDYFAVHTNDRECFAMLQKGLDKAAFGKRSAKIKYSDQGAKHVIYNMIEFFCFKYKDGEEPLLEVEDSSRIIGFPSSISL